MAEFLPLLDGYFIQMEDELAAMSAIIGASWNGIRTMTATSGPGFSLMQENIGFAIMTETPCVVINVSRSGPSTGQPTLPAQGEFFQSRWGTHGDHAMVVFSPTSVQECFDLTLKAFNTADRYRIPVVILSDATVAHMREKLVIPAYSEIERIHRPRVTIDKRQYQPFRTGYKQPSKVPEMSSLGDQYHTHLTGLTHDAYAFPSTTSQEVHERLVKRLYTKILDNKDDLTIYETYKTEDCDTLLISFGVCSRACYGAVDLARSKGTNYGLLNLTTLWPFPNEIIYKFAQRVKKMIVVEMNMGQMVHKVAEYSQGICEVKFVGLIGGDIPTPEYIIYESKPRLKI